ncbi:MAG: hypothetical protein IKI29_06960 [Clostridia bacterium]|nr:hypothetical protein [Clostridia bacterium]
MKKCHVCLTVCEDDTELCPRCGAELHSQTVEEAVTGESRSAEAEVLLTSPTLAVTVEDVVTGDIFRDLLIENGIPFTCDSEGDSMRVVFGGGFAVENIYVNEADLERAKALYEEALAVEPEFDFEFEESAEEADEEL